MGCSSTTCRSSKLNVAKLYTINQCCELLSIGRTKMYDMMNSDEIRYVTIGTARRIPHSELMRFLESRI
ncbi:MAG: transcriptional regulator [Novosphingobium sp.]|nr:transcriptional regulator [Novosphingobium sp.]MAC60180.1 transcriptional regulator [Novosphingobium sp.]